MVAKSETFRRIDLGKLGRAVRERRERSGLMQQQMAARSGISARVRGRIEAGRSNPSLLTLIGIAATLGVATARGRPVRLGAGDAYHARVRGWAGAGDRPGRLLHVRSTLPPNRE